MSPSEKQIETAIRVALSMSHVMCMKNRIEACWQCRAKPKKTDGLGLGSADLICIVPPVGRLLAIECKAEKGRTTEDQERWLAQVRKYGGVAGVARSVEEAFRLVDLARKSSW